jgi:hypothetical protein
MIDAARLVAAHEQALRRAEVEAAANEPPARQFPLAGQSQLRPLADPARQTPESKE